MHQKLSPRFSWKGIPARRQPNAPQIRCKVDAIQTPMWMRGPSWLAEFISSSSGALIIASSTWVDTIGTKCNKLFSLFRTLGRKRISAKKQQRKLAKDAVKRLLAQGKPGTNSQSQTQCFDQKAGTCEAEGQIISSAGDHSMLGSSEILCVRIQEHEMVYNKI